MNIVTIASLISIIVKIGVIGFMLGLAISHPVFEENK
jgi:hypothetical protein